ncbi:H(+)-transporting V1 sector ATPase subunit F [Penicillium macrosclerotiorum]|uniref:H(+)-transporting V1 sector ATPase subunit F n=1 Tax=Penicillium macrosclerotiorum TaxID=303699 RepID=UPI002547362C|nr:H(+)-transporting V1 sector ATPase subunit F [Penicillium macrosclerotiorum]KAJ5666822.1 H(+)-transporting V1 sector ATPase subunit F [Penicillium macrosclerotiorum]
MASAATYKLCYRPSARWHRRTYLRKYPNLAKLPAHKLSAILSNIDTIIQHVTDGPDAQRNFLVVDSKTETSQIEQAFQNFTQQRKDIAVLLINQHVAERIRHSVDSFADPFPAILEIPSKDHPYDPEKDSVLKRVRRLFGE